jgi:hypothetical protein
MRSCQPVLAVDVPLWIHVYVMHPATWARDALVWAATMKVIDSAAALLACGPIGEGWKESRASQPSGTVLARSQHRRHGEQTARRRLRASRVDGTRWLWKVGRAV